MFSDSISSDLNYPHNEEDFIVKRRLGFDPVEHKHIVAESLAITIARWSQEDTNAAEAAERIVAQRGQGETEYKRHIRETQAHQLTTEDPSPYIEGEIQDAQLERLYRRELANLYNCVYHPANTNEYQPSISVVVTESLAKLRAEEQNNRVAN